jgi:MFS family permease
MTAAANKHLVWFTLLVTGLGYFIDSYDVFSFNIVRAVSLSDLGLTGDALTRAGVFILNCQVTSTLIGGIVWGMLGDRVGRKKALLGSILCYSAGMIANAYVHDVYIYAAVRGLVGFGIAGEVGLGATLVGEFAGKTQRTYILALFTALGLLGVTAAALSIECVSWRASCLIGGLGGLLLLLLRGKLFESPLFEDLARQRENRGGFADIILHGASLQKWLCCIFILAPNFFVTGLLLTLAPEMAKAAGLTVKANIALACYFTAAVIGDLLSSYLSERLKARRPVMFGYLAANVLCAVIYIAFTPKGAEGFYALAFVFGLFNLWALATTAAGQPRLPSPPPYSWRGLRLR